MFASLSHSLTDEPLAVSSRLRFPSDASLSDWPFCIIVLFALLKLSPVMGSVAVGVDLRPRVKIEHNQKRNTLPKSNCSLLVRTNFDKDSQWDALVNAVAQETEDGFRAYVEFVDDVGNDGLSWQDARAAVLASGQQTSVLFLADARAVESSGHEIFVVSLLEDVEPFRCIARELWGVDNNLNISNMDWEEFANATTDGVFLGF